jgi:hypothetical protein
VVVLENIVVSKTVDVDAAVEEEEDESVDETLPSSTTAVLVKTVVV